jgi:hypothetical protein
MGGGGGRHGVFELLVLAERELLHFREVTPALLRRHHRAYFLKMPEHSGLTFRTERGDFANHLFHIGGNGIVCGKQTFQCPILDGDAFTEVAAPGQVAFVKLADALEIGFVQGKLLPQPVKIVAGTCELLDAHTPSHRAGQFHEPHGENYDRQKGKQ